MRLSTMLRAFLLTLPVLGFVPTPFVKSLSAQESRPSTSRAPTVSAVLGRPTDRSVAVNLTSNRRVRAQVEYGKSPTALDKKSAAVDLEPGAPAEVELLDLVPNAATHYRVRWTSAGNGESTASAVSEFMTQRAKGSTFTFGVQGDSHPERAGKMFNAGLYRETLGQVAAGNPDFYIALGDDFSVDRLIERNQVNETSVARIYEDQRNYLAVAGHTVPIFLVNGNHEQAGRWMLDGTPNNIAAIAGRTRTKFFSLPAPDHFYTGDPEVVEHVGLLRDYYAWTWGDALFVVLDAYWHSKVPVDHEVTGRREKGDDAPRGGGRQRDLWEVSIGDAQYAWFKKTLEASNAPYKFVFCHHVLGTGRGGVEQADLYEWGGKDRRGRDQFAEKRPAWELPIHQLMVKNGVSIFFQAHDHIYCMQEKDGIVYQSTPNPADNTYTAFNAAAYKTGVKYPNSGHLRVTVSPKEAKIDYVRAVLQKDENADRKNATIAHSYTVSPKVKAETPK